MTVAAGFELVGREDEVRRLHQFVEGVSDGASALALLGEAGIGKTVLWRAGIDRAEAAGYRVVATRCAETETPLAFGGLADLFDNAFAEVVDELPPAQREALAVAIGLEAPREAGPDGVTLPRAFTAGLRLLAGNAPVLVAVDDVQWLDAPSERTLSFAVRRLGDARIGVLVTQRGKGHPLDLARALEERHDEVVVGPLRIGALHQLVRSRLGMRIPRPLLARVHEASGGNPLFALEFARAVADRTTPGPLPVPSSLEELVRERVATYSAEIRPLLAVAAVARRPTLRLLQQTVADADRLLDAAIVAGAVTLGDDRVVRFSHPLLATAIYSELLPGRRRALHGQVGEVVDGVEERARHLALASAGPDAGVARLLDEAAARARARGAPDAAADLAQLGLRLTPPSDSDEHAERMLALAGYLADAGRAGDVRARLDELLACDLTGPLRARALLIRSYAEGDFDERARFIDEAIEHAVDDAALHAQLLMIAGHRQMLREDLVAAEPLARQALAEAEAVGDPKLLATILVSVAYIAAVAGWPESDLLERRAIELSDTHGVLPRTVPPRVALAGLRLAVGDLASARRLLEGELDAIRRSGRDYDRRGCLLELAELELYAGNWARAEAYADEAWELVFDGGDQSVELVEHFRALLAAHRGHVDEARRRVAHNVDRGEPLHWSYLAALNRWTLGFLELSLGEPARASELLADVADRLGSNRLLRGGTRLAAADAVEAFVGIGRLDDAQAVLDRFEHHATADDVWAASAGLRGRALLLLARGDTDASRDAAFEAAAGFEAAGFPFDRGRSLLVAGDALRRLGERRHAAEQLKAARRVFSELGAELWVERAERELRRASPRPRRDRELTSAERRVAALVAAGRTNREVAAQLFTTVGTVEVHLTRIYRKLGIRSRTELARRVAEGQLDLGDS